MKVLLWLLAASLFAFIVMAILDSTTPKQEDTKLSDCIKQTIKGQHISEVPPSPGAALRYYSQYPSDPLQKAMALSAEGCPIEVAAWLDKCEKDTGINPSAVGTCLGKLAFVEDEAEKGMR